MTGKKQFAIFENCYNLFSCFVTDSKQSMSFSVMYEKRSLDIVCKDIREYEAWTRGLEVFTNRHCLDVGQRCILK